MALEDYLIDVPALHDAVRWRAFVEELSWAMDSDVAKTLEAFEALRRSARGEKRYVLERALRQANALVPLEMEGTQTWVELVMLPVLWRDVTCETGQHLSFSDASGLSEVERALEGALGAHFGAVRMSPHPVDTLPMARLNPHDQRLLPQHISTFGDSPLLAPAAFEPDTVPHDYWWYWPVTLQHVKAPKGFVSGVPESGVRNWQRAAQLLEEKLMHWALSQAAVATAHVRAPVSWAEAPDQLIRLRVLNWLSQLAAGGQRDWTVHWHLASSRLVFVARAPGEQMRQAEFEFGEGQGATVDELMHRAATRFPGRLERTPLGVNASR